MLYISIGCMHACILQDLSVHITRVFFFKEFHKVRRCFVVCFQNIADERYIKFLVAAHLILHVTDNLMILKSITSCNLNIQNP